MYKDFMLGYGLRLRMYGPSQLVIKRITLDEYVKSRYSPVGTYTTTSVDVAVIENMDYINHWTIGDDGNIYMVIQDTDQKTAAYILRK
jgi:hypothetical protein